MSRPTSDPAGRSASPNPPRLVTPPPPPVPPPPPRSPQQTDPVGAAPPLETKPTGSAIGEQVVKFLRVAWREIQLTAKAMYAQLRRLFAWGRTNYDQRQLGQQIAQAQEELGRRMEAASVGDPALRKQLAELVERRKSVELAKGPVKVLDAERRGLYLRLAAAYVPSPGSSPQLEQQHQHLVSLRTQEQMLQEQVGKQRSGLLPLETQDRIRVAAGFGLLMLLLVMVGWQMLPSRRFYRSFSDRRVHIQPPHPGNPQIQPVTPTPRPEEPARQPSGNAKPEKVEKWVDEDDYFPRRKFVGTFVNDVPHGEAKCVDDQNRVICVEQYKHGVPDGRRIAYYPSGKKFNEITFKDGVANGTSTTYYENGNPAGTVDFVEGQLTGKSITYFPDGKKCVVSQQVNGVAEGERLHYRPDGQGFGVSFWQNGQQTGQDVQHDVTQQDLAAIEERANFPMLLKDWWR